MAAHPDGTGSSWDEDVDVDRPHGLDYRYTNHIAKAVRKRVEKEHEAFADATAGGEHIPGMVKALRIGDTSADISGYQDSTLFQEFGLGYSLCSAYLWCITANTTGDPTIVRLDPHCLCQGADFTLTGAMDFDASVVFEGEIDASVAIFDGVSVCGALACASAAAFDVSFTVLGESDLSSVSVADMSCAGAAVFDGTCDFTGASFSGDIDCTAGVHTMLGADTTQNSVAGSLAVNAVYLAETDGVIHYYGDSVCNSTYQYAYTAKGDTTAPADIMSYFSTPGQTGDYIQSHGLIQKGKYMAVYSNVAISGMRWTPFGTGGLVLQ